MLRRAAVERSFNIRSASSITPRSFWRRRRLKSFLVEKDMTSASAEQSKALVREATE